MPTSLLTNCRKYAVRGLVAIALVTTAVATRMSPAGYSAQDLRAHVEIDGVNYGTFDDIGGLDAALHGAGTKNEGLHKITLTRDFVTDPSLYLWAKNIMHGRSDLKDVHIVMENREGEEIQRYVLKFCQPLSWTVEAANPSLGGFHEKVDLAVQEITVY